MADEEPERFVANMSKAKRKGRIFVDYLRNGRGATAISPYSTRARAGAFVATPVSWPQLARLKDAHPASIKDARKLLKADPWPDYEQVKQALPLDKLASSEQAAQSKGPAQGRPFVMSDVAAISSTTA